MHYTIPHFTHSHSEVSFELGMLISDFFQIQISNFKIQYKSGYRFWLCRSTPENSASVFPYFRLVVRSLQLYRLSGWQRWRRLMIVSAASRREEWREGTGQTDWQCTVGVHEAPCSACTLSVSGRWRRRYCPTLVIRIIISKPV